MSGCCSRVAERQAGAVYGEGYGQRTSGEVSTLVILYLHILILKTQSLRSLVGLYCLLALIYCLVTQKLLQDRDDGGDEEAEDVCQSG